jgi:nucleolar protein 4
MTCPRTDEQLGGSNPFALPTVLTADPSSSLVSKLVLHGRTLDVARAVTREQAGQMREDGEKARNAGDKRNTYLMREGGKLSDADERGYS